MGTLTCMLLCREERHLDLCFFSEGLHIDLSTLRLRRHGYHLNRESNSRPRVRCFITRPLHSHRPDATESGGKKAPQTRDSQICPSRSCFSRWRKVEMVHRDRGAKLDTGGLCPGNNILGSPKERFFILVFFMIQQKLSCPNSVSDYHNSARS